MVEKLLATISESQAIVPGSRSEYYRRMDRGDIESVKAGKRRLIVISSLHAYAERLREVEATKRRDRLALAEARA